MTDQTRAFGGIIRSIEPDEHRAWYTVTVRMADGAEHVLQVPAPYLSAELDHGMPPPPEGDEHVSE